MQAEIQGLKDANKRTGIFGIFKRKNIPIESQNQGELTDGL